mgnify:FL=1
MVIGLRGGISFCEVGDRLIFLDIVEDRYFGLGSHAEAAFRRVIEGTSTLLEDSHVTRLLENGLLVENALSGPTVCAPPCRPTSSLVDLPASQTSLGAVLLACKNLVLARVRLQARGLDTSLMRVRQGSTMVKKPAATVTSLRKVAAAFALSARLMRSHDRCLVRALAIRASLAAYGVNSRMVIAVRLRPFAAHAWVQRDEVLISDRIDEIASYTPILVL